MSVVAAAIRYREEIVTLGEKGSTPGWRFWESERLDSENKWFSLFWEQDLSSHCEWGAQRLSGQMDLQL